MDHGSRISVSEMERGVIQRKRERQGETVDFLRRSMKRLLERSGFDFFFSVDKGMRKIEGTQRENQDTRMVIILTDKTPHVFVSLQTSYRRRDNPGCHLTRGR